MNILYMGTGAAEGIPGLFCHCRVCENARKIRGKELRTRCQAIINQEILMDFGPDTYAHYLQYDFPLPDIDTLLVTHCHTDHFYAADLEMRRDGLAYPTPGKLKIYGNNAVKEKILQEFGENERVLAVIDFQMAKPFTPIDTPKYKIVPLLAKHARDQECLIYTIEEKKTGKSILYAHDTGIFPEATWKYLKSTNDSFDLISLDCNSMLGKDGKNHMGYEDDLEVIKGLKDVKKVRDDTRIILNHFSHNSNVTHEEMVKALKNTEIEISYDGMVCEF